MIHLIIAALVLIFAGSMARGLKAKAFVPALIAAVAIAVVAWLIDTESNWLPAPAGPFRVAMRMYQSREAILDGSYVVPPIQKVA